MAYKIVFTAHGDHAATWSGYASYADARAALRDADHCIPIHWDHDIQDDQPATEPQEA